MTGLNQLFHTRPVALVVVSGTVFLALSWLVSIGPALDLRTLSEAAARGQPAADPVIAQGRALYLREGCGYCHSQFVRPTLIDLPFGRASTIADYATEQPPLAGTQRTGPDLSDVGSRQPSWIWQFMHLYNPRSMVEGSLMPSYPWYFEVVDAAAAQDEIHAIRLGPDFMPPGKAAIPTPEAVALVTYLRSLRQE